MYIHYIKYIDFPSLLYDLLFFQPWPREDSLGILGPAQRPRFPALSAVVAEAGERYGRWQSHECSEHGHLGWWGHRARHNGIP